MEKNYIKGETLIGFLHIFTQHFAKKHRKKIS